MVLVNNWSISDEDDDGDGDIDADNLSDISSGSDNNEMNSRHPNNLNNKVMTHFQDSSRQDHTLLPSCEDWILFDLVGRILSFANH